jgi:hypothetical protein
MSLRPNLSRRSDNTIQGNEGKKDRFVLEEAWKLTPEERCQLAARLLEEGDTCGAARQDERLEAMRAAADDELFLADLTAMMEDFRHADGDGLPA